MCLVTKQKEPSIAEEDIIIYKKCLINKNKLIALHIEKYHYSKIETAKFSQNVCIGVGSVIREGLHGWIDLDNNANTEWIIPKGTKYYVDVDNSKHVVAEKIVFSKFIRDFDRISEKNIIWKKNSKYFFNLLKEKFK